MKSRGTLGNDSLKTGILKYSKPLKETNEFLGTYCDI